MTEIERYLETEPVLTRAVVCYLQDGEKVLLGLRKKVSFGLGENLVAGIGGKVGDTLENQGESDEEAAVREIEEEIGVKVKKFRDIGRVRFLFPNKPKWNQDVRVYLVDEWEGEPQETEPIAPKWYEKDKLPEKQMWDDNRLWLPKVLSGEIINAVFMFDENNQMVKEYFFEKEIKTSS
jgi:8-oxo-dGTP diphosphatase